MKKLLLSLLIISALSSCGDDSTDPKIAVNCEQLKRDADRAERNYEQTVRNSPLPNATQAVKDKHSQDISNAYTAFMEALKASQNCD